MANEVTERLRAKTVNELKLLRTWCAVNPRYDTGLSVDDCRKAVNWLDDALYLLKGQAPRVMTLEEVRSLQKHDVVWLEDNDKSTVIPAIVNHVYNTWPDMVSFTAAPMWEVKADMTLAYGKRWRSWTSRPTDEQREATPWRST